MKTLKRFLVLAVLISTGCTLYRVDSQEIGSTLYPSKHSPSEVSYMQSVNKPYEVIGYVTVNAERHQAFDEILEKMKKEAAILGADAIINITQNASGSWKSVPAQRLMGNAYLRSDFRATAIVFP
jgi:hypothetical protein